MPVSPSSRKDTTMTSPRMMTAILVLAASAAAALPAFAHEGRDSGYRSSHERAEQLRERAEAREHARAARHHFYFNRWHRD